MPELPEVETVRRLLERSLVGRRIALCEAIDDPIVFGAHSALDVRCELMGAKVLTAGRKGKTFWLQTDRSAVLMHLGMSGWVRALDQCINTRLLSHGRASLDDETGRPRFLKLLLTAEDGGRVAFTDGRRLGRIWVSDNALSDPKVVALGPDALLELPKSLRDCYGRRRAPIKALLLDQSILSGVGNWVADEALYQAGIDPRRPGASLSGAEFDRLRAAIVSVLSVSINAAADRERYPPDWLFHHRWGGANGSQSIGGHAIVREPVGGRTTAWVPTRQK